MLLPLLLLLQGADLGDMVVTAPRAHHTPTTTTAKVKVVTAEELAESGERSLPRAIGRTTGVWIQETNLGGGAPVIRGLLGNKVLILVDGVRLNDSTTRFGPNQSLNTIDPSIVDRVEVVRGPASVLYGSDAVGGAILIWTRRRRPVVRGGYGGASSGLDGLYSSVSDGARASLYGSFASERHGGLLVGTKEGWNDLEAGDSDGDDVIPFTGYEGHAFFGAYEWAVGREETVRATARVNRTFGVPRTDQLVPGFGQTLPSYDVWNYSLQDRRGYVLSYSDEEQGEFVDRIQARLSLRTYREQREKRRRGSDTFVFEEDEVTTLGLGMDWQKLVGTSQLFTFGLDVENDDVDSRSVTSDLSSPSTPPVTGEGQYAPSSRFSSAAAFVQDEIYAFDPFFVTAGLRYSVYDFSFREFGGGAKEDGRFDALTASLEVARELGPGVGLAASLSQGFRAPNLEDLANDGDFANGTEIHNADLEPEESLTAELALEIDRDPWRGAFSVFGTRIDDYVGRILIADPTPGTPGDETYMRANVGELLLWGAEAELSRRIGGAGSPYTASASAAWVRGRNYDDTVPELDHVEARRVPPLNGRVAVEWRPDRIWNHVDWIEVCYRWAEEQNELHPQDVADQRIDPRGTPSWGTLDLDLGGPIADGSTWWAGLHNVLDERYRVHSSGVDAPGFGVVFGLHVSF